MAKKWPDMTVKWPPNNVVSIFANKTIPKIPQIPKFSPKCLPKPKKFRFLKKKALSGCLQSVVVHTYSTQSCLFLIKKNVHQLSKRLAGKCQFCSTVFEWRKACQNANWISSVPIAYMIKSERKPIDIGKVFHCFLINSALYSVI